NTLVLGYLYNEQRLQSAVDTVQTDTLIPSMPVQSSHQSAPSATMAIGLAFVINTLVLGYLYNEQRLQSAVDTVQTDTLIPSMPVQSSHQSAPSAPMAPSVPAAK
ncbi:MAG: hypothetical protein HRT43_06980, partial [Campylobacteraceae bacterium]|nr:hypothetical protein [Campylobacteraceae bacterium]